MAGRTPPGSLGPPLLGETLPFFEDPAGFSLSRTHEHGNVWKTRLLGDTVVFFAGPEAYTFFMDPANFSRRHGTPKGIRELLHPEAVPYLDGDRHQRRKRLLLSAFTDDALQGYLPGVFTIFERFALAWSNQGEQALADDLGQLCFDVANHLFAGSDATVSDHERAADFSLFLKGVTALPVNLPVTAYGRALRARDRLRTYLRDRIAADTGDTGTVMAALQTARDPQGERLTDDELVIELLHFFFAAHGGLTAALAWLLVVLGEHPPLAQRLRAEADVVLGDGPPTVAEVRRLSTARRVSREVLRAYPIVAVSQFGVAEQDLEFDGYRIEAGWKATGAIWPTLQDGSTFADPAVFQADRLDDDAFQALPDNAYVPQGGGPPEGHRCGGEPLTQLLMPAFLGWFTKHYDWHYPSQDASPTGKGLAPLPRGGVTGTVVPRERRD
jgi:retinoid hydroxylase